jgi:type IV pilus assembly protein PilC
MGKNEETKDTTSGTIRLRGLDDGDSGPAPGGGGGMVDTVLSRRVSLFGPSNLDRAVFCRNLSTLIEVGIPLLRALKMLARRTEHTKLAKAVGSVADRVEEGQSISQAMDEHRRIFSPLVVSIVRVGEVGGILEGSLTRLADIMETKASIRRKIRSASMYPAVTLTVALAVIVLIMVKAVPMFQEMYREAESELPGPTQFIIGLSGILTSYPLPLDRPLHRRRSSATCTSSRPRRTLEFLSQASLRIPGIRTISRQIAVARFSRTLSNLLAAGIPLSEALSITADTNENTVVRRVLTKVQQQRRGGQQDGRPTRQRAVFPNMVVDMIAIGEETGTLDRMLDKIADIYDDEVDAALTGISSIIEPVLIVCSAASSSSSPSRSCSPTSTWSTSSDAPEPISHQSGSPGSASGSRGTFAL